MLHTIPLYVTLVFVVTVLLTLYFLINATHNTRVPKTAAALWLGLQATLAYNGFYAVARMHPERVPLAVVPAFVVLAVLFFTQRGRQWLDGLDVKTLTLLHVVRVPVELTLYWLFTYKAVPEVMTFAGRNFDILAGLTAPVVYYWAFVQKTMPNKWLLGWNIAALLLLVNIVATAILSLPMPFQQFGFEQPNVGVLYFPFILLPAFVVPVVVLAHLVAIRRLLKGNTV